MKSISSIQRFLQILEIAERIQLKILKHTAPQLLKYPGYLSSKAIECQWDCVFVFLFVCSLSPPKRRCLMNWILRDDYPGVADGFRLKKSRLDQPLARKPQKTEQILAQIHLILLLTNLISTSGFATTKL